MARTKTSPIPAALRAAFPHTIPILAGFLFIGIAYGVYMNVSGFGFVYPMLMSLLIFGGSLEFLAVAMLLSKFSPLSTLMVALMVQARHLFYGIAMLDKYKGLGWKRAYLIFGLCDETFSVNCTAEIPDGIDRGWFYFFVTLLNQLYWVCGATLGGLLGSLFTFNTAGLDFVMTAMFVVIFLEQCRKEKQPWTALIGLGASLVCLLVFGADSFILPSMVCIFAFLLLFKKPIAKAGDFQ
ncbi:MAG: branched-chain amino acid transporter AzlC [Ruminococcaceae bacterium]|nr:branched-chain amino acid transporter AzlC [Oscillospiraceae bacterium]